MKKGSTHNGGPKISETVMRTMTPEQRRERASKAARASHANKTPEQRREHGRRAYLAGAVNAVVDRALELTPEQVARLREMLKGLPE